MKVTTAHFLVFPQKNYIKTFLNFMQVMYTFIDAIPSTRSGIGEHSKFFSLYLWTVGGLKRERGPGPHPLKFKPCLFIRRCTYILFRGWKGAGWPWQGVSGTVVSHQGTESIWKIAQHTWRILWNTRTPWGNHNSTIMKWCPVMKWNKQNSIGFLSLSNEKLSNDSRFIDMDASLCIIRYVSRAYT